jgi:hypothetical protein
MENHDLTIIVFSPDLSLFAKLCRRRCRHFGGTFEGPENYGALIEIRHEYLMKDELAYYTFLSDFNDGALAKFSQPAS